MKPEKFAALLNAHGRLLRRAGATAAADGVTAIADFFAVAKGASVKTALRGAQPATQPNPAAAQVTDLIADLKASIATISAKSPAIADLDLLGQALNSTGACLAEIIAGWAASPAKPAKRTMTKGPQTSGSRVTAPRQELVDAYCEEIKRAGMSSAALGVVARLASDKKMRLAELVALARQLGATPPAKSAKRADLLRLIRLPFEVEQSAAAKEKAILAKGTL